LVTQSAGDGVTAAIAALGCVFALGCSSDSPADAGDAGRVGDARHDRGAVQEEAFFDPCSVGDGAPTYAPTYTAVYCEILSQSCAVVFCHSSDVDYLVINNKDQGYGALVNAPALGPNCAPTGLKRVDPGHPETSLLFLKVTSPPCGARMPRTYGDASGMLDPPQIEQIRQWIEAGALNN
jgi:hypothetical protein